MNNIVCVFKEPNKRFIVYYNYLNKDGSRFVDLHDSYQANELLLAIYEDGSIKCRPLSLEDIIMNEHDNIEDDERVMTDDLELWIVKGFIKHSYGDEESNKFDKILDCDYEYKGEYEDALEVIYNITAKLPDLYMCDNLKNLLKKYRNYENEKK